MTQAIPAHRHRVPRSILLADVTVFLVGPLNQVLKTTGWLRSTFLPQKCSRIRAIFREWVLATFVIVGGGGFVSAL
jgi:hypothetical protein